MDSLATVSAEKSKMEATFQADKKQLKGERDQVLIIKQIFLHITLKLLIKICMNNFSVKKQSRI